jgi:hypothetical protein
MSDFQRAGSPLPGPEKGYSWLFFYGRRSLAVGGLVTLLVIGGGVIFYLWYLFNGDNLTPMGNIGLSYAIAGLAFLLLAAASYTILRRLGDPALGQLNRALTWHGFFALIGLALLSMHSFGEFGLNSGTYALFSMILLTLSGLLGRVLDRVLAWRIAIEANETLAANGEDRLESITQEARTLVASQAQRRGGMLFAQIQATILQRVQQATQRERFYRLVIRVWRQVHIALALLTLGLTIWHVLYEMPFLYRALF